MNFIKSLFKSDGNQDSNNLIPAFPWIKLETNSRLEEIVAISKDKPVVIFKHSTRCGISRMVIKKFEKQTTNTAGISFYYLDLLNHRGISNAIADRFDIVHQSPQLLLIKEGKLVATDSHYGLLQVAI